MLKESIANIFRRVFFIKGKISHGNSWDMSDIFIVSYPKSGTTWLCLILANIIQEMAGDSRRVDFYSVHDYVPDFHFNPQAINKIKPQRFIKTHESFDMWNNRIKVKGRGFVYPRVIYLVRDGKKATASSFGYLGATSSSNANFLDFIANERSSYGTWDDHVDKWVLCNDVLDKRMVHVIRHEDLVRDAFEVITSILNFSGINASPAVIKKSIENSDISVMRDLEGQYGNGVIYSDQNFNFARKKNRLADDSLLKEVDDYFSTDKSKSILKKMGY